MNRLGLGPLLTEIEKMLQSHVALLAEEKQANGARRNFGNSSTACSKTIGRRPKVGDIDWVRCKKINGTQVCLGVEIQVSGRSEMLYKDVLHLRRRIECGDIDLGVVVVPSDRLQRFLPDRTPSSSYAVKVIKEQDADRLPIVLIEIEHDGPGPALIKRTTNTSRRGKILR